MPDQFYIVNPFSSQAFEGSAVGVCILEKPRELEWMVGVARSLNLTDAAFLIAKSPNRFDLRCIAGALEVDLGISATFAAAHVLFDNRFVDAERSIAFYTHGGPVSATIESGIIEVNFPVLPIESIEPPEEILQAVDPAPLFTGRRGEDYAVQVSSESRLKKIYPDLKMLDALGLHGLIITSEAPKGKAYDFALRTFQLKPRQEAESALAAWVYAALGPFWMTRFGKAKMKAFRHAPKSMVIPLEVDGDRVKFFGEAVTILHGELKL
jgi:predicted PhzF superfamily epimerase YddE/YHI9